MKCPFCKADNDVVRDSRSVDQGAAIRRRRECQSCGKRFTTYERYEGLKLWVLKQDKRREKFDREKIFRGIELACQKRPISVETIQEVVDHVIERIQSQCDKEVPSWLIGQEVMRELSRLDEVAFVRFASVYRRFETVDDFVQEVKQVSQENPDLIRPEIPVNR